MLYQSPIPTPHGPTPPSTKALVAVGDVKLTVTVPKGQVGFWVVVGEVAVPTS
jgi:hypothetical protein